MNEKTRALGKNVSEQYLFCYAHTNVYCVYTRNLGANLWLLLGACLCLLGACLWLGWVQSMRKLGAKYMDTFGCMSILFGCMYAAFGCMSMAPLGACMRLLGACLTVGSFA